MPSPFENAWQGGAALDSHFGEAFLHFPVARNSPQAPIDVNAPAQLDGLSFAFTGVFRTTPVERFPDSRGHATSDSRQFTSGLVAVEFPVSALLERPRRGDVIVRARTGIVYEVSDSGEEMHGRLRVKLTARR